MCLYIDTHEHKGDRPKAKRANKDIPVYKLIGNDNRSRHQFFKYTRRKTYELGKPMKVDHWDATVDEGFHAYVSLEVVSEFYYNGLYCNLKIVRFTIPKGARYFIGQDGDIVSNKIRSGELRPLKPLRVRTRFVRVNSVL